MNYNYSDTYKIRSVFHILFNFFFLFFEGRSFSFKVAISGFVNLVACILRIEHQFLMTPANNISGALHQLHL